MATLEMNSLTEKPASNEMNETNLDDDGPRSTLEMMMISQSNRSECD